MAVNRLRMADPPSKPPHQALGLVFIPCGVTADDPVRGTEPWVPASVSAAFSEGLEAPRRARCKGGDCNGEAWSSTADFLMRSAVLYASFHRVTFWLVDRHTFYIGLMVLSFEK